MPGVRLYREVPVFARIEDQLISGRIHLLGEDDDGFIIFNHKSFPESRETWEAKALDYAGQLALYGQAVANATYPYAQGHRRVFIFWRRTIQFSYVARRSDPDCLSEPRSGSRSHLW